MSAPSLCRLVRTIYVMCLFLYILHVNVKRSSREMLIPDAAAVRAGEAQLQLTRRGVVALALLPLLPAQSASALFGLGGGPSVEVVSKMPVCQGRARVQDYVVVRYTGRYADGRIFDDRYAQRPLVYQLGSFYLPGVDAALAGACVGTKLQVKWPSSPALRRPEDAAVLPPGSPIEMELELVTIKYSLFGETMRDPSNSFFFTPGPVTLNSAFDTRGHPSGRPPEVKQDNPFALNPTEDSIISNAQGVLKPILGKGFGIPEPTQPAEPELLGSRTGKDG